MAYVLIPHDEIIGSATLSGLVAKFDRSEIRASCVISSKHQLRLWPRDVQSRQSVGDCRDRARWGDQSGDLWLICRARSIAAT